MIGWPEGRAIPWSVRNAYENGVGYQDVIMRMEHASSRKDARIAELEERLSAVIAKEILPADGADEIFVDGVRWVRVPAEKQVKFF